MFLLRSTDGGHSWSETPELTSASTVELGGVEGTLSCVGDLCFIVGMETVDIKRQPDPTCRTCARA